ncbi:MAG: dTDP-glucose 4,6-dehydratase [Nitrospirae bacterium]|nr:dTDP-glucose 4,6-dehydratase [Nitrospirota bacterium]
MTILVTGGAGFIGSNFVLEWVREGRGKVINLDKLTYAGNLDSLAAIRNHPDHQFIHGEIGDQILVSKLLREHRPKAIINFAAESHVDRSIHSPWEFIQTNVVGVFHLLNETFLYWKGLNSEDQSRFRFLHISTDEVYGSLGIEGEPFREDSPYQPNSPYAASKASSDHLVRSYFHTYGLPTLTTNCSNNYGPYQHPEKLIPLMILNALKEKPLPVYGDGKNIRDWLYVEDHCSAIRVVLEKGRVGETYNIGGRSEKTNIELVKTLTGILDGIKPRRSGLYEELIQFVTDRPGHDRRYAINARKIENELGWQPKESFKTGLEKTVRWLLEHQEWTENISSGKYKAWIETNYASREQIVKHGLKGEE